MPPFWQERLPYSEHLPMSVWNVICSGLSKSRLASRRAPLVMCCSLISSRAAKTTSITRSQSITRRKSMDVSSASPARTAGESMSPVRQKMEPSIPPWLPLPDYQWYRSLRSLPAKLKGLMGTNFSSTVCPTGLAMAPSSSLKLRRPTTRLNLFFAVSC